MKMFISLVTLTFLLVGGCATSTKKENEDNATSKKTSSKPLNPDKVLNVAFVIVDGVYNSELVAPMDILHHTVFHTDKGMKVFTVAPDPDIVTSFEGLKILPDYTFSSDSLPPIDVLVVPSAEHSMDSDLENEELITFIREKGARAAYVMSLCDGAFVLAKAGLVNGKESTTFPSDIGRYRETFPSLTVHEDVSFVHDGKLITSVGGAKSYDPALYLAEILYGKEVAKGLGRGLVIDWDLSKIDYIKVD
ncbi:glutamine amidotransferase [Fulvivirga sp. RKSG066]|uniref:DJ-1/PfpI family protein n=1 Tax=Fulvivirga aurantia TaxID=2529383 RepID=UPI0012BCE3C9|nr:DJ-1/PfpI family protein [Fulvivirga aurantia]MTI20621.1 glutamine amidotransferase [Fulvivirga aurantia]